MFLTAVSNNLLFGDLRIGLLSLDNPLSLTVNICEGRYRMMIDGHYIIVNQDDNILINRAGSKILITTLGNNTILADSVILEPYEDDFFFSIRNNLTEGDQKEYYGKLIVKSDIQSLLVINEVNEDCYLAGVVQAEAGFKGSIEYFKTQTLLARTYLYMYINRHREDGYNLCDRTHCQAYHGKSQVKVIREAVNETRGQVLTSQDSILVFTPFHSNCGGQTQSSENVWLRRTAHLLGVTDPYCAYSRNARWMRKLRISEWILYLTEHGYTHHKYDDLAFEQLSRKQNYSAGSFSYPLTRIREDLKLKSTFFSVKLVDNNVILEGRGYGHGVGLCQEGAKVMAQRGFKMKEIIGFYFQGLQIMDINDVRQTMEINSAF